MHSYEFNFVKMEGLGNDYIFVDLIRNPHLNEAIITRETFIRKISRRSTGIGSDGLVLIKWNQPNNMFEMRMFNADGSEARMCGNALRCIGHYVFTKRQKGANQINVLTGGGVHRLTRQIHAPNMIQATMGEVKINPNEYRFMTSQRNFTGHLVEVGNFHYVAVWPFESEDLFSVENTELMQQAAEHVQTEHPLYNVNFLAVLNDRRVKLCTVERGSGLTLACGTGAAATAAVCVKMGLVKSNEVDVVMRGGTLHIGVTLINNQILVNAIGEANTVFEGTCRISE